MYTNMGIKNGIRIGFLVIVQSKRSMGRLLNKSKGVLSPEQIFQSHGQEEIHDRELELNQIERLHKL